MRPIYYIGWGITRVIFLASWLLVTEPVGVANVWFKEKYLA